MILRTVFTNLVIFLIIVSARAQIVDQSIRIKVLEKGIVDSTFIFGRWTKDGQTETHLKYLGQVTTKHGQTFKIVNYVWFWGLSKRSTSRILVFNEKNQYVGNYYLTVISDLPMRMNNGKLIFHNTEEGCDKKLTTIIDLNKGLPKQFFRKCKEERGDSYYFNSN